MKRFVYLLRDLATESFSVPMFFQSEAEARRSIGDAASRPSDDNLMNQHPEHFMVYYAGTYDDQDGLISSVPAEFVFRVTDVMRQKQLEL